MRITKQVLIEAKAVIELGVRRYHWMNDEQYEKELKAEASELMSFLRDHRSRDHYGIDIETTYEERCIFCWHAPSVDEETGEPGCCDKAHQYWEADQYCLSTIERRPGGGA